MGIRGELFSTRVMLENRTYFFNVKENRTGDLYLNIVESKNRENASGFDRQSVILFAEDLQDFLKGFDESLRVMEKAVRERKRANTSKVFREGGREPGGGGRERRPYEPGGGRDYGKRERGEDRDYGRRERDGGRDYGSQGRKDREHGAYRPGRDPAGSEGKGGPKKPRRMVVRKNRREDD
ncbi:MAG: DUF3276 family protein [Treponema sp.]|jgi:hypothetical protein|nr:DUF3276 family protein [Treponema sp.]